MDDFISKRMMFQNYLKKNLYYSEPWKLWRTRLRSDSGELGEFNHQPGVLLYIKIKDLIDRLW